MRFAELIGEPLYSKISDETLTTDLIGEWIFSNSLFHHQCELETGRYLDEVLRSRANLPTYLGRFVEPMSEALIAEIVGARDQSDSFLDRCCETILECRPQIVGFTSVFLQQVASLSLAKRIKSRSPGTFIVFGGANCEGVMGQEMVRQFDFIDSVISGEGEIVFPEMARRVMEGRSLSGLPGVFRRDRSTLRTTREPVTNATPIGHLDDLPVPDYDDYLDQLRHSSLQLSAKPNLLFETSRGCWWGEKHHCTFCGLNGQTMAYRSKTAGRAFAELTHLLERYPGHSLYAVDNILNIDYFKDFIPMLADRGVEVEMFYEVKANLNKNQLRQLRDAGVSLIQPGIESLSDRVLRMMRKGVKALQNIQLLKWCKELGVVPVWNVLWGFPGEPAAEYDRMAELVPLITHLPPPNFAFTIRLDRFSPNFAQAEQLGFRNLSPYPAYRHVYPLPGEALANLAYYFTFEYTSRQEVGDYVEPLAREIAAWQECYPQTDLFSVEKGERLLLWDTRPIASKPLTVLTGLEKFAYLACDRIRTPAQILESWKLNSDQPLDLTTVRRELDALTAQALMVRQDESYLALAVARTPDSEKPATSRAKANARS
jgi:ribosomal peptide maturation radical SAM protein 1